MTQINDFDLYAIGDILKITSEEWRDYKWDYKKCEFVSEPMVDRCLGVVTALKIAAGQNSPR